MQNLEYTVNLDFARPDSKLLAAFEGMPSAGICDCLGRMAALDSAIVPMNTEKLLGPAFTVKVPEGDNLMVHMALDLANPGDILVVDAGGAAGRAIIGELMARYAEVRGLGGIIIDGAVRDVAALAELRIPVYAVAVTPAGPYKNGPGQIGVSISVGGQVISAGDILAGDEDGVVVVRPHEAEAVAPAVRALMDREAATLSAIAEQREFERPWLSQVLKDRGLEP